MKRFLTLQEMCDMLAISKTRYRDMKKEGTQWYDPNLPQPIDVYGDTKIRFYSADVEAYVEQKLNSIKAA